MLSINVYAIIKNIREKFRKNFYSRGFLWERRWYIQRDRESSGVFCYLTQTSHIKNGICSLKNQYFSSQNSAQAAAELHSNAFCMYFGSL